MGDGFLADSQTIYIEKEIASRFNIESIIDEFESRQHCRVQFS